MEEKEKGQKVKDWRVISMEKTLAVLTDGLDTGRGALALCILSWKWIEKIHTLED